MPRNGAVLDLRRPFPDGDGIDDLTTVMSAVTGVPRAADSPLGTQVLNQLFFQHLWVSGCRMRGAPSSHTSVHLLTRGVVGVAALLVSTTFSKERRIIDRRWRRHHGGSAGCEADQATHKNDADPYGETLRH